MDRRVLRSARCGRPPGRGLRQVSRRSDSDWQWTARYLCSRS